MLPIHLAFVCNFIGKSHQPVNTTLSHLPEYKQQQLKEGNVSKYQVYKPTLESGIHTGI